MKRPNLPTRPAQSGTPVQLRHRAEARLRQQQKQQRSKAADAKSEADPYRLLHELQVHQVELEMQNAELQAARDRMEVLLEKYTDLYDFAPVGYLSLNEQGQILEVNLTGAALLGVARSQLINRRLPPLVAAANRPIFLAFLEKVFGGDGKQVCEVTLVRADGSSFWASIHGTTAIAVSGSRQWCRVVISDISSLKEAEDVLRRSEALFAALIEQAPVGMYVVDARLRLQQVNPRARPVFSKVHPLAGRDLSEIMHILWPKKIAHEVMAHFRHTLKTGKTYIANNFSERRQDIGVTEFYEWQIQRITLPAGEQGVVCFFSDVTERKHAEAARRRVELLAATNQKLESEIVRRAAVEKSLKQSERRQSRLLAQSQHMQEQLRRLSRQLLSAQEEERKRISRELHDVIAQTLTSINIRLSALKQEALSNTRGLERSIARTQRLVEHSVNVVHRFARELRPTALDDLGLIPALHAFMKGFKEETGIQVSLSAFAAVEQVNDDQRTVLYRVAQEALNNAARHAHANRVRVEIQKLEDVVCMKIKDNGKGFPVDQILHSNKSKRLGLLGMKERLDMVGGRLTVKSTLGRGTTILAQILLNHGRAREGRKTRAGGR